MALCSLIETGTESHPQQDGGGTPDFEQSVAAGQPSSVAPLRGLLRRLPLNANVGPQRQRVRESHLWGTLVDSNWRGMAGSLGRSAARRLPCSRLATTAGSLGWQGSLAGTSSCSFADEKPALKETSKLNGFPGLLGDYAGLHKTGEVEGKANGFNGLQKQSGAGGRSRQTGLFGCSPSSCSEFARASERASRRTLSRLARSRDRDAEAVRMGTRQLVPSVSRSGLVENHGLSSKT